ncbi:MAG: hypothetical protein JNN04_00475 [Cyclobacteriaceae bacterium]|nr:hypothetical protein [Cyclobacteriaceae bacterium]
MKKALLIACLGTFLAACNVLEDSKTEREKTVDLLTGGTWKVDSLVYFIKSESPGMSIINFDTVYLNAGTWEFQAPGDSGPGFNTGYLLHRYTKGSASHTDTLAWVPYSFDYPISEIDNITIFYPDTTLVSRQIVVNDIKYLFTYQKKESAVVRIEGAFGYNVGSGATVISNNRRYHLTR